MDKVKVYLKVLKKHHFWVMAAIVVIVSFSVWSSATGKLDEEFKKNKSRIISSTSSVEGINNGSPNETFKDGVERLRGDLRKNVYSSWQEMYKVQKPRFVWPKLVEALGALRDPYLANWDAKYPPPGAAATPAAPTGAPPKTPQEVEKDLNTQSVTLRQSYNNNVIREELKRLFQLVRVRTERRRPAAAAGKNAPRPKDAGDAAEYDGIVFWDETQRNGLIDRYYASGSKTPELGRVLTTQEDLWIIESMLNVIELLNKDAKDPLAAVVKRIEVLDVAQWATKDAESDAGKIRVFAKQSSGIVIPPPTGGAGGPTGAGGMTAVVRPETESDRWFNGRYLDENMQPLLFNTPAPFAEFKQVFVRMKVLMDQRKTPELLAACANAQLPIEVRQMRMTLDDKTGTGKRREGGGAQGAMFQDKIPPGPYDGLVDIRGIVYIYNKPDENKVGTGASATPAKRQFGIPTNAPEIPDEGETGRRRAGPM